MSARKSTSNEVKPSRSTSAKGRRRRRSPARIGIGDYGEAALGAMHRRGGVTPEDLAEELGVSLAMARRTLRILLGGGMVKRAAINAAWMRSRGRPRDLWYLDGDGIAYGASVCGEENAWKARRAYRRVRLPAHTVHCNERNLYYLRLRKAAEDAGIGVPLEEMWAETHPDFPLYGSGTPKSGRADAALRYVRLEPDGAFELARRDGLGACRFHVEVELSEKPRYGAIVDKIDRYAACFRRLADDDPPALASGRFGPVVFLFRQPEAATAAHRYVGRAAKAGSGGIARYLEWREFVKGAGARAGRFFLFGPLGPRRAGRDGREEDVDPLGRVFEPLTGYPEEMGGWRVGLEDAAALLQRERSRVKEDS